MKNWMLFAAVIAAVGVGCKKKKPEEGGAMSGSSQAMGSGGDMGSAMGSASGSAGSGSAAMGSGSAGSAAEAKPMTAEEMPKRFDQCWGFWSDGKWDDFKTCYAADAVSENPGSGMPQVSGIDAMLEMIKGFKTAFPDMKGDPQFELVSGHTVIGVTLVTGTNTGPLKMGPQEMPATSKKVGFYTSQVLEVDDQGRVKHEWEFVDFATMMGQLNPSKDHPVRPVMDKLPMPKEVVIAKDDDKEKANLELAKKMVEGFNKHDAKAVGDVLADDVLWSVQDAPADTKAKKDVVQHTQGLWKGFSDLKITPNQQWAAGDYVAAVGTMDGTNDGDIPMMKLKKTGKKISVPFLVIHKLEGGKIKATWIFEQGMAYAQQLGLMPPAGAAPAGAGSAAPAGEKAGAGSAAPAGEKKPAEKKPADKKPADKKPAEKKG